MLAAMALRRTTPRLIRSDMGRDAALLGAAVLAILGSLSPYFGLLFAERAGDGDPMVARPSRRGFLKTA
jgi:hypothetical protein